MTTITTATVQNNLVLFFVYLLRNNLTDPLASRKNPFVYKDAPEAPQNEFPFVIVEYTTGTDDLPTLDNSLLIPQLHQITIRVVSKGESSIQRRDVLTDEIRVVLSDPTSADADGDTIKSNQVSIRTIKSTSADMTNVDGETLRINEVELTVRYYGA